MTSRCRTAGLDESEFSLADGFVVTIRRKPDPAFKAVGGITGEVAGEVQRLLTVLAGEMKRADVQKALALRHEDYFREAYLDPALISGLDHSRQTQKQQTEISSDAERERASCGNGQRGKMR